METKQTAVDWLFLMLNNLNTNQDFAKKLYDKSKEMEKEQIINAHLIGLITSLEIEATKQAEQYYNENYGKE